jgi:hypothetical protein
MRNACSSSRKDQGVSKRRGLTAPYPCHRRAVGVFDLDPQFLKGRNKGAHKGTKDEGQGDTNYKRGNDPKRQVNHDDFPPLQSKLNCNRLIASHCDGCGIGATRPSKSGKGRSF